jgi:DUF971 family protein
VTASTAPVALTDHALSGVLEVQWPDGHVSRLPHALLRRGCRCAACEHDRRALGLEPAADSALRLQTIEPVGQLGLHLAFSDGHARGIYPWPYLRELSLS